MANILGAYDPVFYANEALIWLRKTLGFGSRVYRAIDPTPTQKGSTITIRRPMTFAATAMPAATSDVKPDSVSVVMDTWKGVHFALTDKELAFSKEQIIEEHIAPAAYAVADAIDSSLAGLYKNVPYSAAASSGLAVADITGLRKQLSVNGCPMNDGRISLALSPTLMKEALDLTAFTQWQGGGQGGADAQATGMLGAKFGMQVFENQNVQTHTSGVAADATGALNGAGSKGDTTIAFDGVTAGGTFNAGDTFVLAGSSQRYAFTGDYTADVGGAVASAGITPALVKDYADNTVMTIQLDGSAKEVSLAFHRDAFCLAMGVLPDNLPGADVFTVTDPQSGLSVRARRWYDGTNAKLYCGIDALWGVKTLNGNLAARLFD